MAKKDDGLFNAWVMKPDTADAYNTLQDELEEFGGNCVDVTPSPWIDYSNDAADGEPFPEPSAVEAVMMCAGCPVVEACFAYAKESKQSYGIWGGVKFRNGKEKKQ